MALADTAHLMSTTQDLVNALKSELRAAGVTYADLADALGMSESSVKRVFAKSDMPLSRIDEMLRVLKMDFAELARKVADAQPLSRQLTVEQEAAVVADRTPPAAGDLLPQPVVVRGDDRRSTRSATPSASSTSPSSIASASSSCARSTAIGSRSRRDSAGCRTGR